MYLLIKGEIPSYYKYDEITQDPRNLYFNVGTGEFSYYSKEKVEGNSSWKRDGLRYRDETNEQDRDVWLLGA